MILLLKSRHKLFYGRYRIDISEIRLLEYKSITFRDATYNYRKNNNNI